MTTPIPPTPTPVPEGLATEVRNLGEQVDELLSDGCIDFYEAVGDDNFDEIVDNLWLDGEDTPCSQNDPRFAGNGNANLRKACLQCFAYNEYGVRINAENDVSTTSVRYLVRALININALLTIRIGESCPNLDIPDKLIESVFAKEIVINVYQGNENEYASSTYDPDNDSLNIDVPTGQIDALKDNTYTNLDWLILHELSHGFHNRLGSCDDENPLLSPNGCEGISLGGESFPIIPPESYPIVAWQFLEYTSGYWNLTGGRDYGDWLRTGGYNSTDKGVVPLTSLNDVNGQRIMDWYSGDVLNGNQGCPDILENAQSIQFVYVNRASECSTFQDAGFYRVAEAYIPQFEPDADPNIVGRMPNATGVTRHASPTEDFADSLAHFIRLGSSGMRDDLGLGEADSRVAFIEENFCGWIANLIDIQ